MNGGIHIPTLPPPLNMPLWLPCLSPFPLIQSLVLFRHFATFVTLFTNLKLTWKRLFFINNSTKTATCYISNKTTGQLSLKFLIFPVALKYLQPQCSARFWTVELSFFRQKSTWTLFIMALTGSKILVLISFLENFHC